MEGPLIRVAMMTTNRIGKPKQRPRECLLVCKGQTRTHDECVANKRRHRNTLSLTILQLEPV